MELRQLENFVAVADAGHFTHAAEHVRLSQSALSSSIKALERELGTTLFERTTRTVRLTAAGTTLRESARRVLAEVARTRHELASATSLEHGELAIGVVQTLSTVDMPAALAEFHQRYPGVGIALWEEPVTELLAMLDRAELDLAYIARDDSPLPTEIIALHTFEEPLAVILGPGHQLAERAHVELRALAGEPFIEFQAGTGLQTTIDTICSAAGLNRCVRFRVGQMNQLLSLVWHGLGTAIIPRPIAERSELPVLDIDPPVHRSLSLVSRGSVPTNPAARAFLELMT